MQNIELRDWLAGQALPQAIAHELDIHRSMLSPKGFRYNAVAQAAYEMADAMLRARTATAPLSPAESQAQWVAEVAAEKGKL